MKKKKMGEDNGGKPEEDPLPETLGTKVIALFHYIFGERDSRLPNCPIHLLPHKWVDSGSGNSRVYYPFR